MSRVGATTGRDPLPNIVVILTDEEREPIWTPPDFRLPHRERLAERGQRFTGHHVHSMPCTPSRSTIVTGRHTQHTGMFENINFHWQPPMRTPAEGGPATWATMLAEVGYRSSWIGKWHLGGVDRRRGLEAFGFHDWRGPDVHGFPMAGHFHDRLTARQAVRWLDQAGRQPHGDRPWLLVVSFVNPHDIMLYPRFRPPWIPALGAPLPDTIDDDLLGKPVVQRQWRDVCDLTAGRMRSARHWQLVADGYHALQQEVDGHIGSVLDALDRSGGAESTVVMCTSDHGDMAGAHGLRQKGPFVYREAMNVPLTIVWPGRTTGGSASTSLTAAVDIAPTLCDIAGLDADETPQRWSLAGRSLVPMLDDPDRSVRDSVLFTADASSSMGPGGRCRGFLRGFTDGRWKFARYFEPGDQHAHLDRCDVELYDLEADPFERHNLAADPVHVSTMHDANARLDALIAAEVGDDSVEPVEPSGVPTSLRALNAVVRLLPPTRLPDVGSKGRPSPHHGPIVGVGDTIARLVPGDGSAIWPSALVVMADLPVDREVVATWLPPGLRVPDAALARLFVADYPTTSFGIPYREVGLLLHARTARRQQAVLHCCWMAVDDDSAMIFGRELLGFPKKLATIELDAVLEAGAGVRAGVHRRGQKVLSINGVVTGDGMAGGAGPRGLLDRPIVNVWGPPGPLPSVLLRMAPPERVQEGRPARLSVELPGGDHDPLASLIGSSLPVEVDGWVLRTDLGSSPQTGGGSRGGPGVRDIARFVAPIRLVGPRWVTRHYLSRTR